MKQPLSVGSATARNGEVTKGRLALGHAPDGPIESDVYIASGREPGPTIWIQSLVHGEEIGGALAIGRFLASLDLTTLRGSIIALPVANPLTYRAWSRNVPVDGSNLNRCFPGEPAGSHTSQIAATLLETMLGTADVFVDLHSGGDRANVPFYSLYWSDDSEASEESARLARACGTADVWATSDDWLTGAMFKHVVDRGKPSVIVECGGNAMVTEQHIDNFVAALTGISQAAGTIPGEAPTQPTYRLLGSSELVFNRIGGIFATDVKAGDVLNEGDEVGRIIDIHGKTLETIRAPFGPVYLAALRRNYLAVHSGEMVCEALAVVSS